jgi:hypothetical protein
MEKWLLKLKNPSKIFTHPENDVEMQLQTIIEWDVRDCQWKTY